MCVYFKILTDILYVRTLDPYLLEINRLLVTFGEAYSTSHDLSNVSWFVFLMDHLFIN